MMRGYGLYGGYGMGGFGMFFVGLLWVLFIVAIVILIVALARRSRMHEHGGMTPGMHGGMGTHAPMAPTGAPMTPPVAPTMAPPAVGHDEAVAIARRRFASGEISKEQFDEIMKALG